MIISIILLVVVSFFGSDVNANLYVTFAAFEFGTIFGIALLIYISSQLFKENKTGKLKEAFDELDKISGQSKIVQSQSLWDKISSQKINIIDKRSKEKRKVITIGEKGETF